MKLSNLQYNIIFISYILVYSSYNSKLNELLNMVGLKCG